MINGWLYVVTCLTKSPSASAMTTETTPLLPRATPDTISRRDFALLMIGLWSLTFISSLDGTIVATLISNIGSSLESMQLSSWIGTAYLLALCAFTPIYGRLTNILGRRFSSLLASVLFGTGTVLCGVCQSMPQLIACRALAGVGGAGMTVVGSVIVSDVVPLKSRGLYQGFTNLLFGLGAGVGGPLGGWLGDTIGWRAAFLCQAPVLVTGSALLFVKVREPESVTFAGSSSTLAEKLKRIDYAGTFALLFTLLSFLVGLNYKTTGGHNWTDVRVWSCLTASAMLLVAFLVIEFKFAAEPVLPISMLKLRTPGFVALNNFLVAVLTFSMIYSIPLYFTAAFLRTSTNAGAHLISNSVGISVGSLSAGWYMRRTGRYWKLQLVSGLSVALAATTVALWNDRTPEWFMLVTLAPFGYGYATMLTTTLLALIASVPRDDIPMATSLSYLFRTTGQVLGVSLSAAVTQTLLAHQLRARITGAHADQIIARILDSTTYIHTLPDELKKAATTSWALSLHTVFYCQIVLAGLLLLSTLPIQEWPLPDKIASTPAARRSNDAEETPAGEQ
ncbi:unnamed protein product [Mycena citricolor]|uniref:Major facilitator superfamily (MFS) profile domain-containing protein n=1 Tax=Mycena citricolor TaxID=2018698 RepID=A0AAD2GUR5_9AGAR|nr:unnamed protein product [Mycena citricolor]